MCRYILFLFFLIVVSSCNKDKPRPGNSVELYLLSSFQLIPGKCQIDSSSYTLQEKPLISNRDILQYTRSTCIYSLTKSAVENIKRLPGRTPFAITVDRKVIFFGFYMPPILSSACFHSITMDQNWNQDNSIKMNLGYPGSLAGTSIDDQRNNPTLIATFVRQGKLK